MKNFIIDVETTGTDAKKNGIVQFSGIIEINGKEEERLNYFIQPFPSDEIDQGALKVNGIKEEDIESFKDPRVVYRELVSTMEGYVSRFDRSDKFHFIGYNSNFDDGFLRAWFEKNGDKYYGSWFFWPPIDVAVMAAVLFYQKRPIFKNYQLMTVAKFAGIEIDESKAHDSLYDVDVTRELFHKISDLSQGVII